MLFESQTETFNRPEFRLHLGVYGTALDESGQLIRYDMRLTTSATDINGKAVPTLAWLPLPGFGASPTLAVDRFLVELQLDRKFILNLGRFPSPYGGTEMLFDHDYHFQGLSQSLRFDRMLSDGAARIVPRLELLGVQGYLAQNRIGLPDQPAESSPLYMGAQFRMHLAPFERAVHAPDGTALPDQESDFEFRLGSGIHWYNGANEISRNLGVGYLEETTNMLRANGELESGFMIAEGLFEFIALRTRRAQFRAWAHGVFNLRAKGAENAMTARGKGLDAGAAYGMDRFIERWDFQLSARYFYIEADAVIPEFNSESLNTNIKGYEVEFAVRIFPTVTAFGIWTMSERVDHQSNGFGLLDDGSDSRSSGRSLRIRFGLFLEF